MNQAAEEGPGGKHDVVSMKTHAHLGHGTTDPVILDDQVIAGLLENPQIGLVLEDFTDRRLVQNAVGLGPCRPDCGALAAVEHSELDACAVRGSGHRTAEGVDFLDQMTLADTTDGRVAAHLTQCFDIVGEQQCFHTHAGSRQRSLRTGMTATYHYHVKTTWKFHNRPRSGEMPASGKGR